MPRPPQTLVPWRDDATDEELGRLLRYAVGIVRREAGRDAEDSAVQVEVKVTLRG
jgi:hypothetical protein